MNNAPAIAEFNPAALPLWEYDSVRGAISREFVFADFVQAFAFMTELAMLAEKRQHHPEWSNCYNRVWITLTTHDAGGLTERDTWLAACADRAFAARTEAPVRQGDSR